MAPFKQEVENKLFAEVAALQIELSGNSDAVHSLATMISRGFQADIPQSNVYEAVAKYITDALEYATTSEAIRATYFSDTLRAKANIHGNPAMLHENENAAMDLDKRSKFIAYVFEAFYSQMYRVKQSPVTRVGVVTRIMDEDLKDVFQAQLYHNKSTAAPDIIVWFVNDTLSATPWTFLTRTPGQAPALPPADSTEEGNGEDLLAQIFEGNGISGDEDTETIGDGTSDAAQPRNPYETIAPTPGLSLTRPNASVQSNLPIRLSLPPVGSITVVGPALQQQQSNAPAPATTTSQGSQLPAALRGRHVNNAPRMESALPWDLLADCTLEELVIYYPNHVFTHPMLALLLMHYEHRLAGQHWSFTQVVRRVAAARGLNQKETADLVCRVKNWIIIAASEVAGEYKLDENVHYERLYKLIADSKKTSVTDLLQSRLRTVSKRNKKPEDVTPLHVVGAAIRDGHHPPGSFADRVRIATNAAALGVTANIPTPQAMMTHPMISLLADQTRTLNDRNTEDSFTHNQNTTPDRFIRPPVLFHSDARIYKRKPGEPTGQIWEWHSENETMIDFLSRQMSRQNFVRDHWRDFIRDAWLWLEMEMTLDTIGACLPPAAFVEFDIPFEGDLLDRTTPKGEKWWHWKASAKKKKQHALEARLKHIKPVEWKSEMKNITGRGRNAQTHPHNKGLYKAEKDKFDLFRHAWRLDNKVDRFPIKRPLGDESTENGEHGLDDDDVEPAEPSTKRLRTSTRQRERAAHTEPPPPDSSRNTAAGLSATTTDNTVADATPNRPSTHDDNWLYNASEDGVFAVVPRLPFNGIGPAPEWWRVGRRALLQRWDIDTSGGMFDEAFDDGMDVAVDAVTGRPTMTAGDFSQIAFFATDGSELPDHAHAEIPIDPALLAIDNNSTQDQNPALHNALDANNGGMLYGMPDFEQPDENSFFDKAMDLDSFDVRGGTGLTPPPWQES